MASRTTLHRWLTAMVAVTYAAVVVGAQAGPRIGPRDQLKVTVFGEERLSGQFAVDPDGQVNYPFVGPVKAAGLTARELEAEVARLLKAGGFYTTVPQITVELTQTQNKKVTVTGSVQTPGLFLYAGELTVLDALVRAGSPTTDAGDEVMVVRAAMAVSAPDAGDPETMPAPDVRTVSLRDLQSGNVNAVNFALQDGDVVIVQKAQSVVISGAVQNQGAYRIESGTTVLRAVALAGGLSDRGTMRGVQILRAGKPVKDVKPDTIVQPGDTIVVKTSVF